MCAQSGGACAQCLAPCFYQCGPEIILFDTNGELELPYAFGGWVVNETWFIYGVVSL